MIKSLSLALRKIFNSVSRRSCLPSFQVEKKLEVYGKIPSPAPVQAFNWSGTNGKDQWERLIGTKKDIQNIKDILLQFHINVP